MASPDLRQLPRNDLGVLAAGLLAFIASFFPYYGASVSAGGFHGSASTSAWHSYATLALLLILVATAAAAAQVFAPSSMPELGSVSWNFVVLGLSALGTLLLIIRSFTLDHGSVGGFSYGLKWGAYVLMVICIAHTVFSYLRVRASGEAMPWAQGGASPHPPTA